VTQGSQSNSILRQQLGYTEYMVNALAESAKQYWRWWGPLGEPMIRATDEWAEMQRKYLRSLGESQGTQQPGSRPQTAQWTAPLRGLTFDAWPGPGDSEGGGWDR
jgi:hypothetical protein